MIQKVLATLVVVGIAWGSAMDALAQMDSAALLTLECRQAATGAASLEALVCVEYLTGVFDGANMDRTLFCPERGTTRIQFASFYVRYMQAHSELSSENRITSAYAALKAGMACRHSVKTTRQPRFRTPVDPADTASALMMDCNPMGRPTLCMNYLWGVIEGANIQRQMFCPHPVDISLEGGFNGFKNGAEKISTNGSPRDLPLVYYAYARNHPKLMDKDSVDVVHAALKDAFACKN